MAVRGSRVFTERAGEGDTVLLLHGGFGTNEDFASIVPELAKHFTVVAFERPGHGHTADTGEPFTYSVMTGYTVDFIEAMKLGPVHLIGWSDGGIIALLVAISRPDLVGRIVPVSANFDTSYYTPQTVEWLRSSTPESFRGQEPAVVKRYEETSPDGPSHFPVVFRKTMGMWLAEPNIPRQDLARISAPALVMAGDHDVIPAEHTVELFRSIREAELSIVPGTTHWLLAEKPEETGRAMVDFLKAKG